MTPLFIVALLVSLASAATPSISQIISQSNNHFNNQSNIPTISQLMKQLANQSNKQSINSASMNGDPIITGFHGQKFHFGGTPNRIFNLISTINLSINSKFIHLNLDPLDFLNFFLPLSQSEKKSLSENLHSSNNIEYDREHEVRLGEYKKIGYLESSDSDFHQKGIVHFTRLDHAFSHHRTYPFLKSDQLVDTLLRMKLTSNQHLPNTAGPVAPGTFLGPLSFMMLIPDKKSASIIQSINQSNNQTIDQTIYQSNKLIQLVVFPGSFYTGFSTLMLNGKILDLEKVTSNNEEPVTLFYQSINQTNEQNNPVITSLLNITLYNSHVLRIVTHEVSLSITNSDHFINVDRIHLSGDIWTHPEKIDGIIGQTANETKYFPKTEDQFWVEFRDEFIDPITVHRTPLDQKMTQWENERISDYQCEDDDLFSLNFKNNKFQIW